MRKDFRNAREGHKKETSQKEDLGRREDISSYTRRNWSAPEKKMKACPKGKGRNETYHQKKKPTWGGSIAGKGGALRKKSRELTKGQHFPRQEPREGFPKAGILQKTRDKSEERTELYLKGRPLG